MSVRLCSCPSVCLFLSACLPLYLFSNLSTYLFVRLISCYLICLFVCPAVFVLPMRAVHGLGLAATLPAMARSMKYDELGFRAAGREILNFRLRAIRSRTEIFIEERVEPRAPASVPSASFPQQHATDTSPLATGQGPPPLRTTDALPLHKTQPGKRCRSTSASERC